MKVVVLLSLLVACREAASEAEPISAPCEGCLLDVPDRRGPVPLVVLMHGDDEQASKWFERWREPALAQGFAVLALQCPEELGCKESCWYRWGGDPRWVIEQVAEVEQRVKIDRSRTFLVGWSGGATYIGLNAERWHRHFAAIAIHGGGVVPKHGRCPSRAVPAYFFVGDRNMHHGATKRLHDYFERCGSETRWDLIEGADHDEEDDALDARKAGEILEWLAERARARIVG
jgi:poly(3-hydroxybutyrate) depolymerase